MFPSIQVVDIHRNNKRIWDLTELTQTALGSLIFECEQLLEEIKNAEAKNTD